jgi:hypothetical protein
MLKFILAFFLFQCATAYASRSVIVDPHFAYYKDRSPESIVEEIKVNGYDDVRLVAVNESDINGSLVKAFRENGFKVWMLTFVNGVYSTADLPEGWQKWQMKLRGDKQTSGFTYLCLNNPLYLSWKKKQLVAALNKHPFHGIDLAEAFIPAYNGPESEFYGCLCERCAEAFKKMYPEVPGIPDFSDSKSPRWWKTDKMLYEKWIGFRVATVVNFLDELVNGKDGIREKCPDVRVCTWSLGLDVPDQLAKLREWEALDAAAIVRRVKPDVHMIQTDWPDWIKENLKPTYALRYKPIADSVREVSPNIQIMLQCDIGSQKQMRRGREWIRQVEEVAKKIGCESTTYYEYHLGDYIYTEPPRVISAVLKDGVIRVVFNKRLDSTQAANISSYSLSSGRVDFAKADGNVVLLSVSGAQEGVVLTVSGLSDDESRRLFHDKPACVMEESQEIVTEEPRETR